MNDRWREDQARREFESRDRRPDYGDDTRRFQERSAAERGSQAPEQRAYVPGGYGPQAYDQRPHDQGRYDPFGGRGGPYDPRSTRGYGSASYEPEPGSGYGRNDRWHPASAEGYGRRAQPAFEQGRYDQERRPRDDDQGYRGQGPGYRAHGGGWPGAGQGRESSAYAQPYGQAGRGYDAGERYREEDRSWFNRARDEVEAWFGDEEAERRRRMDAAQHRRREHDHDTAWNDPIHPDDRRQFRDRDRW